MSYFRPPIYNIRVHVLIRGPVYPLTNCKHFSLTYRSRWQSPRRSRPASRPPEVALVLAVRGPPRQPAQHPWTAASSRELLQQTTARWSRTPVRVFVLVGQVSFTRLLLATRPSRWWRWKATRAAATRLHAVRTTRWVARAGAPAEDVAFARREASLKIGKEVSFVVLLRSA